MQKNYIHLFQDNLITVGAVFEDSITINDLLSGKVYSGGNKVYTFKANADLNLNVGDFALVHATDELKVVKIVEVHDFPQIEEEAGFQYKWVIQKIDLSAYRSRLEEEKLLTLLFNKLYAVEQKALLEQRIEQAKARDNELKQLVVDFHSFKAMIDVQR
ncbi:hypothetical protein [Aggregatibacter kilianii]|uniref:hypothetical protein n=1 Tax=Aggregatibacter kilianii TaxID=2025884 RepID=UPI000D65A8E4|nr:hypothetical protein [Aggregatibacter kilianii]